MTATSRRLGLALLAVLCASCGGGNRSSENTKPIVLTDSRSGEVFTAATLPQLPAANPKTGKRTVTLALFCPKCAAWQSAPPPEVLQRSPEARKCRKCGGALETDGAVPDSAVALP